MLWSAPRSRSTAFFRMMAERGDFTMVHEPFSYLAELGYADVAGERVTSAADLIGALGVLARRGRVFAKETTGRRYPEVLAEPQFLAAGARHTFLIRHPRETIASRYALDPRAGLDTAGFESQYEIFTEVSRLAGQAPAVIDSDDLITRPGRDRSGLVLAGRHRLPARRPDLAAGRPAGVAAVEAVARGGGGQHRVRPDVSHTRGRRRARPYAERLPLSSPAVLRETSRAAADLAGRCPG